MKLVSFTLDRAENGLRPSSTPLSNRFVGLVREYRADKVLIEFADIWRNGRMYKKWVSRNDIRFIPKEESNGNKL